ncbi:MAG: PQQ-binding-like beta-propeller repeat protein [Gemmataceae bacterium]|nr:PQQ-binding-like beta-propeller repeat protein [Gemmataceae bacterium]
MKKLVALTAAFILIEAMVTAQSPSRVLGRPEAPPTEALNRLNMKLSWKAFVPMDGPRDGIATTQLLGDQLFVQTRAGAILALNAETGQTIWSARIGAPYKVLYKLGHNHDTIFALNTTWLFALDRPSGQLKWLYNLASAPSAAPVADAEKLYVCYTNGKVGVYDLTKQRPRGDGPAPGTYAYANKGKDEEKKASSSETTINNKGYASNTASSTRGMAPIAVSAYYGVGLAGAANNWELPELWQYAADARLDQSPLYTPRHPDHPGYVMLASSDGTLTSSSKLQKQLVHAMRSDSPISAPMAQHGETAYIPFKNGTFLSMSMETGKIYWRLSVGGTITHRADVLDDDVYLVSTRGGLHRIDRKNGDIVWRNGDGERFLAANKKIVYALDRKGDLMLLDRTRGTKLSGYDTRDFGAPISNDYTDRVYLASNDGLLICLHDKDYAKTLWNKKFQEDKPPPPKLTPEEREKEAMKKEMDKKEEKKEMPKKEMEKKEEKKE